MLISHVMAVLIANVVTAMAKMGPDYAVMRDASFAGDDAVSNFAEIFKNYSPVTEVEVI